MRIIEYLKRGEKLPSFVNEEITADIIITEVCKNYNMTIDDLKKTTRVRRIVEPRQYCFYFMRKYTTMPITKIGKYLGNKHHATVLHSEKVVKNLIQTSKKFKKNYIELDEKINNLVKN